MDAHFVAELVDSQPSLVIESRGGRGSSSSARNTEYNEGLELVLSRLATLGARIANAYVDSVALRALPIAKRRLRVERRSYPLAIEDPAKLRRELGKAQAQVGRSKGAKGAGISTKRLRLVLEFSGTPPTLAALTEALVGRNEAREVRDTSADAPRTSSSELRPAEPPRLDTAARIKKPVGVEYVEADESAVRAPAEPFAVDPEIVERGTRGHCVTQNALAQHLRSRDLVPLSPSNDDPEFDVAWRSEGVLYVAEIKSVTNANEEKQLRLGLGQVLRYRHLAQQRGLEVVAVLVAERKPRDPRWMELCAELQVRMSWPEAFSELTDRVMYATAT